MRLNIILLALSSSVLSAQSPSPGSIQGKVTDDQNKAVAGALVMITRTFATPKDVTTPYSQSVKTAWHLLVLRASTRRQLFERMQLGSASTGHQSIGWTDAQDDHPGNQRLHPSDQSARPR